MKPIHLAILIVVILVTPFFFDNKYVMHLCVMTALMGTVAISINMMLQVGQLSFAHISFMSIGAYGSALLSSRFGLPTEATVLIGGLAAAALAYLLGPIFLRVRGVYFVLLTFAFSQIVSLILQDWISVTGGNSGLYGVGKLTLFGYKLIGAPSYYVVALVLLAIAFGVAWAMKNSSLGKVLGCLEENEALAQSLGVEALSWRNWVFASSAFFAGLAGAIYAHYLSFISPVAFSFNVTVDAIIMNVVGGIASPFGPLLGAILIVPLPELMRDAREFQLLGYAVTLMVILLFFRNGIVGVLLKRNGKPTR